MAGRSGTAAGRSGTGESVARATPRPRVYATVVTPKQLTTFHRCPLQHHLQYRRKVRGAIMVATPPLAEGNALHEAMRRWFRRDPARRAATHPATVDGWLDEALPAAPYADTRADDPHARDRALHRLSGEAGWCLAQIPGDIRVRAAERQFQTGPLRLRPDGPDPTGPAEPTDPVGATPAGAATARTPVRFQARLDLLVEHGDGELEHIDFKTGGPRSTHWIQRAVERLVVGQAHPVAPDAPPTRTTTLYSGDRRVESIRHTPESFGSTRSDLRDLTRRMLAPPGPAAPAPTPAGHCAWCPYRETACPAHRR